MATPVPVVSMMYFFVSLPPKTFSIVSPDFPAMSVKLAICAESLFAWAFVPIENTKKMNKTTASKDCERGKREQRAKLDIPACILGAALARVKTSPTDRVLHRQALRHS